MKRFYSAALITLMGFGLASAQEYADSAMTSGNTQDVYLHLNTGVKTMVDRDNWDLAFETKGTTASVLINGQKGVKLYTTPFTIAEWANFDTTGMSTWVEYLNSSSSWSNGAFNQQLEAGNDFDLGWGKYNIQNHVISGDSVFLLQLADGAYKKIYINDLTTGTYTFTYADVDGSNEMKKSVTKNDMGSQNFGFYSIEDEKVVTREPATTDWDLVFTEYVIPIPTGPGMFLNYPVTGIKVNKGVEVAQRDGMAVTSDDTTGLNWNMDITEIGSDWKTFNRAEMKYEYAKDRAYFVRLEGGSVWKIYFTKYEGGPAGNFFYTLKKIETGASVESIVASTISVYPNPSANQPVVVDLGNGNVLKQIAIYNQAMQLVKIQDEATISTTGLNSGLYFVSIETAQGTAVKRLLIK